MEQKKSELTLPSKMQNTPFRQGKTFLTRGIVIIGCIRNVIWLSVFSALRKKLCKNNQLQKNDFVVRAADRSLSFLFQYKLNTAVCQAPDAKYPDATERSAVKSGYFAAASVQPVRIHYLKLTEHLAPVPKRHCPFFGYLRCCRIQCL